MTKRIQPPHVAYTVLGLTFVAHVPVRTIIGFPHTLWGIPLVVLGLLINAWASTQLYRSGTTWMTWTRR